MNTTKATAEKILQIKKEIAEHAELKKPTHEQRSATLRKVELITEINFCNYEETQVLHLLEMYDAVEKRILKNENYHNWDFHCGVFELESFYEDVIRTYYIRFENGKWIVSSMKNSYESSFDSLNHSLTFIENELKTIVKKHNEEKNGEFITLYKLDK